MIVRTRMAQRPFFSDLPARPTYQCPIWARDASLVRHSSTGTTLTLQLPGEPSSLGKKPGSLEKRHYLFDPLLKWRVQGIIIVWQISQQSTHLVGHENEVEKVACNETSAIHVLRVVRIGDCNRNRVQRCLASHSVDFPDESAMPRRLCDIEAHETQRHWLHGAFDHRPPNLAQALCWRGCIGGYLDRRHCRSDIRSNNRDEKLGLIRIARVKGWLAHRCRRCDSL